MSATVFTKHYDAPAVSEKELYRYMGCKEVTPEIRALAESVMREADPILCFRVCYQRVPLLAEGDRLQLGGAEVQSRDLAKALAGCDEVLLFAATLGLEADRLIARHSRLSPARALALQAYGAERIESLCDAFLRDVQAECEKEGLSLRPRFSPGYGDLSIGFQAKLFEMLDCARKIGLTLNQSLLMSPTKSVTAIVGLTKKN